MYSKGCGLDKINEARHRLFTSGQKNSGKHTTHTSSFVSAYQTGCPSGKLLLETRIFPTSVNGANLLPYWTTLEDPVKHVTSSCTVAVNGLVRETMNAVEPEFAAHGYATLTTLRQNCFYIPIDSPSKEDTVYNCEVDIYIREQNVL